MKKLLDKEKRKAVRKTLRRIFRKDTLVKGVIALAVLSLILTSILPYLL